MSVSARTYEDSIWHLSSQLALVRFSLRHFSTTRQSRRDFLTDRKAQIRKGWERYAEIDPEQFLGMAEKLVPIIAEKESTWIQNNLGAIIEFGEHRLNEMELVLRYAFCEATITDVIGNILWEYPEFIDDPLHQSFDFPKKPRPDEDQEDFRARRTEKLVDAIDKLRFLPPLKITNTPPARPRCLIQYLSEGLRLDLQHKTIPKILEKVRVARNTIAHRSEVSPKILTDAFMNDARFALSEFPRQLIAKSAEEYPDASTMDEGDGGMERPGYVRHWILKEL
ncbi:MAG: hypothetical protein ABMA13_00685 [Chthoniobacteraceae bacterium]